MKDSINDGRDNEERAVDEAKKWLRDHDGKGIPHEEALADFGLTLGEFHKMGEQRPNAGATVPLQPPETHTCLVLRPLLK